MAIGSFAVPKLAAAPDETGGLERERRQALLTVTPLLALIGGLGAAAIPFGPNSRLGDSLGFGVLAIALLVVWMLSLRQKLSEPQQRAAVVGIFGGMMLARVVSVFTGAAIMHPDASLFFGVFAFFPVYFTLFIILYPYPRSAIYSGLAWLMAACLTTFFCEPYLHARPFRQGLVPVLLIVWVGYPVFLLLINSFARSQLRLLRLHADAAATALQANRQLAQTVKKMGGMFNQAAVGFAILDLDGKWLQVNDKLCAIVGYSEAELLRIDFQTITHPDDLSKDLALAGQVIRGEISSYSLEKRYIRKDRSTVWINLSVSRLPGETPADSFFVSVVEDISARKHAETALTALNVDLEQRINRRTNELRLSNQRWQDRSALLVRITELIGLLPSAQDEDEACRIATMYLPRIFPNTAGSLYLGDGEQPDLLERAHWGVPTQTEVAISSDNCWGIRRQQAHLMTTGNSVMRCQHAHQLRPGRASVCLPLMAGGNAVGMLNVEWDTADVALDGSDYSPDMVLLRTVSEQLTLALTNTRLRMRLQAQALNDPLTGLHNRRHLESFLKHTLAVAQREQGHLSVLLIDIDHFKRFNDEFGHDAGDLVITTVAQALSRSVRGADLAFRYGGEEFVVVLTKADQAAAGQCAERIMASVRTLRLTYAGRALPQVTVSMGLAVYPTDGIGPESLLRGADAALYKAKQGGRNQVVLSEAIPQLRRV